MITIDTSSPTPPFEQLRVQLMSQISSGELAGGARLPTVRKLAEDLGLAPNTVARTYRELEADGFITTRGRNGSFITPQGDPAHQQAQQAASTFAERIRKLGIPAAEGIRYAAAALDAE
jgi:DNA-binding transcriptional regulator YhcF (GntR family)